MLDFIALVLDHVDRRRDLSGYAVGALVVLAWIVAGAVEAP